MENILFNLNNIRFEISFKSYDELRTILVFFQKYNLNKINIPCKNSLKKDFLLNSIKISREEFPHLDLIPHFSILHEFRRNRRNTELFFNKFLQVVKYLGCNEVLLISGSKKRSTLDSVSALCSLKDNPLFSSSDFSIGVAFNPYLPCSMFDEEIIRLERKIQSGIVSSIWIQFGTDINLLESRIEILKKIILSNRKTNYKFLDIKLFGSILIPSKQFLVRFKYRPWKGVYCSREFLEKEDHANHLVVKLLKTYIHNDICPIIETNVSTENELNSVSKLLGS
tara:strand:- start:320 stop:1165 length:846 start_codon:yes stop_codon:yes gene_type:complete